MAGSFFAKTKTNVSDEHFVHPESDPFFLSFFSQAAKSISFAKLFILWQLIQVNFFQMFLKPFEWKNVYSLNKYLSCCAQNSPSFLNVHELTHIWMCI